MAALAIVLFIALALAGAALWARKYGGYMPEPYRSRACQGAAWRQSFPGAPKDEIRGFLGVFAESFSFRQGQKLQVGPDDKVLAVYRAVYPRAGGIDALELETFAQKVEQKYSFAFGSVWNEQLTFGQLFRHCSRPHLAPRSEA